VIRKAWSTDRAVGPGAPVLWEQQALIVCPQVDVANVRVEGFGSKPQSDDGSISRGRQPLP
jgi:hypothetical protein